MMAVRVADSTPQLLNEVTICQEPSLWTLIQSGRELLDSNLRGFIQILSLLSETKLVGQGEMFSSFP